MRREKHKLTNKQTHTQLKGFVFDPETKKYFKVPKTHESIACFRPKNSVPITSPERLSRPKNIFVAYLRQREIDAAITCHYTTKTSVSLRSLSLLPRRDSNNSKSLRVNPSITAAAPHPFDSMIVVAGERIAVWNV